MTSVSTDRRFGVNSGKAVKVPCKVATTANITLSGEQTIDGVACVTDDRILVRAQTTATENGIWVVDTGSWSRSVDFDDVFDVTEGTLIPINHGSTYATSVFRVTTTGTITPGSTSLSFALASHFDVTGIAPVDNIASLRLVDTSSLSTDDVIYVKSHTSRGDGGDGDFRYISGAAPSTYTDNGGTIIVPSGGDGSSAWLRQYSEDVNVKWFGAVGDNSTDDTTAIQTAINVFGTTGGTVLFPAGDYKITSTLVIGNGTSGGVFSTKGAVRLKGTVPTISWPGFNGGARIHMYGTGYTINYQGPMVGWGIEDITLISEVAATTTSGIIFNEAQYGVLRNVQILNYYGVSLVTTTYGNNNCSHNVFDHVNIYLPAGGNTSNTIAVLLTGSGVTNNSANNVFRQLFVQPTHANQILVYLQYADTNTFYDTDLNPLDGIGTPVTQAIYFDYNVHADFPNANTFFNLEITAHLMAITGVPGSFAQLAPNEIYSLTKANSARIPNIPTLPLTVSRKKLWANKTFYVSTTGDDTLNTGDTAVSPWLTLQRAWDVIINYWDLNGFTATVQIADGTYTGTLVASYPVPSGKIIFSGNAAAPSNVIFNNTGIPFLSQDGAEFTVQNLRVTGSTVGELFAQRNGIIYFNNIDFAASGAGGSHIWSQHGGCIECIGDYYITGNADNHVYNINGTVRINSKTVTITGAPAFAVAFANSNLAGSIEIYSDTFAGAATGQRYTVNSNSVVDTRAGGAAYLPGNVAGATATGGQYI